MSNLQHGFYSNNIDINPDSRMLSLDINSLTSDDLVLAERFLYGDKTGKIEFDVIKAHEIAKVIYQYGRLKYRTLWSKADSYINSYEFESLEKIANLPG